MKNILKAFFIILGAFLIFEACNKVDDLPYYPNGTAPVLTSDVTTVEPTPADSNNTVLTLSWSNPKYATDSGTVKYLVQIDSSGKNFSNPYTREVTGTVSTNFIAKDLNTVLLGFGFQFGVSYSIDIRVVSSYANNNDQQTSNTVTIEVVPYVVPPKVQLPSSGELFITGDATAGGWQPGNGIGVPVPAQQFTRLDSVTYEDTFYLNGGKQYLLLPVNGSWDAKYALEDNTVQGIENGGSFGFGSDTYNSNFKSPSASGMYTIHVDFQQGTFTVTPVKTFSLLYVAGDYQGWDPASAPTLASVNSDGIYEGYVNVPAGGTYKFKLTSEPDWNGTNYGDGGTGKLSTSGGDLTFPGAGYFKINANTKDNTWSATATTWGLIGSFAGSGWSNDVDMTYNSNDKNWTGTITIADGDEFKFRSNHDWGLNYGDTGIDGSLEQGGDNIKNVAAGTHTITLYLGNSGYYTYRIQ